MKIMPQRTKVGVKLPTLSITTLSRIPGVGGRAKLATGYTLVELMVSLVLTALLVVAVLGVTVRLAGHRRLLEREHPFNPWQDRFTDQLARDYASCQSIVVRPRQILMETIGHQDTDQSTARRFPALVVYSVVEMAGRPTMVRFTKSLASEAFEPPLVRNIICEGVTRFRPMQRLQTDVPPRYLPLAFECATGSGNGWTVVLVRDGVPR